MATQDLPRVRLPYKYEPRDYQVPFWRAMDNGAKRAVLVWLRRAGKDKTCFNYMVREAYKKAGVYYYMLPEYGQARKAIWDGVDSLTGMKFIDHVPPQILLKANESQMKLTIQTIDGKESIIQLVGSDKFNNIVGTPPVGIVISEWSISNPAAWEFMRPILAQNNGWAIFNYTPRGRNHGYKTYLMAKGLMEKGDKDWYCQFNNADNTDAISLEAIEAERRGGMSDEMVNQEFYCSFDGSVDGSYYGRLISAARAEGRIKQIAIDPTIPVDTYWDLGLNDAMAVWFHQLIKGERRMVHYFENSGGGLAYCIRKVRKIADERNFSLGKHGAPHDIRVREQWDGVGRLESADRIGHEFEIMPRLSREDGIDACRNIIPTVWFDEKYCAQGIEALDNYHKEWDNINRTFKNTPKHDWASNGADAFRTFATMAEEIDHYNLIDEQDGKASRNPDGDMVGVSDYSDNSNNSGDFNPHDY